MSWLLPRLIGASAAFELLLTGRLIYADTALRLGKFFKTGAAFWMNIQTRFDLETAEDTLAPQIKKIASHEAV